MADGLARHAQLRARPEVGPRVVVAVEVREVQASHVQPDAVPLAEPYAVGPSLMVSL